MKLKFYITLVVGLFCIWPVVYTQNESYPVEIINGKEYYRYKVQSSEGLYAISKKFGVTQSEINNINPQIHDGLKAGQEILVPKTGSKKPAVIPAKPAASNIEYILHTVEQRQTLFAISRKYNVTQDEIIEANPKIKEQGLKRGDVIRIPVKTSSETPSKAETPAKEVTTTKEAATVNNKIPEKKETPVRKETKAKEAKADKNESTVKKETPEKKEEATQLSSEKQAEKTLHTGSESSYITHIVEPQETFYSISRKYNVSVEEIKNLNPESAEMLKIGTSLRIPFKSGNVSGTTTTTNASQTEQIIISPKQKAIKGTYKIAFLLPFMLENSNSDPTVEKFIEFYMGSLLAINNAKNGEVNFEIYTYDIEKSETKVFEVINKPEMQEMDLIIGPAYTAQTPVLTDFAKRHRINTVIPFSSKVAHIESNPYVFQFNPDQDLQNEYMLNIIRNRFTDSNLLFVETGDTGYSDEGLDFFSYLMKKLDKQNIAFKKITGSEANNIQDYLQSEGNNLVIFDSDNEKSVNKYLNKLHDLNSKFSVGVLGQYAWRSSNSKKPRMFYVSPFAGSKTGTDFYEQEYQKYYGKFRSGTNPRFDLLGYDLTTFFLSTMKKDGFTFTRSAETLTFDNGVQSDLNFVKTSKNGGFVNHQMYLIEDEAKRN